MSTPTLNRVIYNPLLFEQSAANQAEQFFQYAQIEPGLDQERVRRHWSRRACSSSYYHSATDWWTIWSSRIRKCCESLVQQPI